MPLTPDSLTEGLSLRVTKRQMARLAAAATERGTARPDIVRALLDNLPEPPGGEPTRRRLPQASAYHRG